MDSERHDKASELYWDILERAASDPEYIRLRAIMEELEERYEALTERMADPSRRTIDLYITSREYLNRRLLEFACEEQVSSDTDCRGDH